MRTLITLRRTPRAGSLGNHEAAQSDPASTTTVKGSPLAWVVLVGGRWGGSLSVFASRPAPTSQGGPLSPVASARWSYQGRSRSITAKVRIAPMTNKKVLKPIPTVTPPQTSRVCRQGR
jgi:hypothetical protein